MALRSAVILNTLTGAMAIAVASSFSSKPLETALPEPREVGLRAPKSAQLAYQVGWVSTSGTAGLDCRLRICDATACCGIGLTLVHWVR